MKSGLRPVLVALAVLGILAWPPTASAKEGAMFNPMLMSLASGHASRHQLYVMSVIAGGRTAIPSPPPGSVPVVLLRAQGGGAVLRFTGSPLDRSHRSVVLIKIPASRESQRWVVSVRANGHVYPDRIDSPVVSTPAPRVSRRSGSRSSPWWPPVVFVALLVVGTALIGKRMFLPWQARS